MYQDLTTKEDRLGEKLPSWAELKLLIDVVAYSLALLWAIERITAIYF